MRRMTLNLKTWPEREINDLPYWEHQGLYANFYWYVILSRAAAKNLILPEN